ncbi:MAG: hypothetical protein NTV94_09835 [Planctomycetota bacterium]|nr:hypothetical protein [Planctomycetota bacterium]
MRARGVGAMMALGLLAAAAGAQPTIDPAHKYVWSENGGWLNFADAGDGGQSVLLTTSFLSGYVWSENFGYISLGDGSPANGVAYGNLVGQDSGVNILADDTLSGFAWGENIGWINFNTASTLGAFGQQARIDYAAQRFRGYAWGENIGWINLDDDTRFVGLSGSRCASCVADYNIDGGVDFADVQAFFGDWESGAGCADANQDGIGRMLMGPWG